MGAAQIEFQLLSERSPNGELTPSETDDGSDATLVVMINLCRTCSFAILDRTWEGDPHSPLQPIYP